MPIVVVCEPFLRYVFYTCMHATWACLSTHKHIGWICIIAEGFSNLRACSRCFLNADITMWIFPEHLLFLLRLLLLYIYIYIYIFPIFSSWNFLCPFLLSLFFLVTFPVMRIFFYFSLSLLALQDVLDGLSKDCNCLSRIVDEKVARNKKCVSHNTFASVWKVRILCAKKYWCLPTVCHTYGYRFASVLKHIFNLPIREFFGLVYARHMVTLSPACG